MANTLKLEIVTPDAVVYHDDVHMVTLPGIEGELGSTRSCPAHHPDRAWSIVVTKDGHDSQLAVGEGLVDITADSVTIVTDMAIPADRIDEEKVEEARQRAAARLEEKLSDEEVASVNASLARSLAQLHVKRRHRG
jgi:F-type H+-transporting ATPase subunit epsilon